MIVPFINFAGQAGEAITLYETVFDVQGKEVHYYRDMPADLKPHFPPETDNYVMHSEMTINGTTIWIGDSMQAVTSGEMVSLSVPLASTEEVRVAFDKLKEGGTVLMEPEPTFYSPLFGSVKDRFGVIWHLICQ